jgi:hypothetical protein
MSEEPVMRLTFTSGIGERCTLERVGDMLILRGEEASRPHPLRMGPETILGTALLAARESAAATVEAAGCICEYFQDDAFRGKWAAYRVGERGSLRDVVEVHDPRCPTALAVRIREG